MLQISEIELNLQAIRTFFVCVKIIWKYQKWVLIDSEANRLPSWVLTGPYDDYGRLGTLHTKQNHLLTLHQPYITF